MGGDFVRFDLVPMTAGVLAAAACAVPGNFLLLRRQALMGDAISHTVLPGVVAAFLVTGRVDGFAMLTGAAAAALVAAGLIEAIKRLGRIESGAAMGVVFTAMFAAGVFALEQSPARGVHLDVEHALMGSLESLVWLAAEDWSALVDPVALAALPPALGRIALAALLAVVLTLAFWRPLTSASFDPTYARAAGLPTAALGAGLVAVAAVAAVAAFDAVGSIIVIAMFIAPPATARLLTDSLRVQAVLSVVIASAAAIVGYGAAVYGPMLVGGDRAVSAAGMIASTAGVFLGLACAFGPKRARAAPPAPPPA